MFTRPRMMVILGDLREIVFPKVTRGMGLFERVRVIPCMFGVHFMRDGSCRNCDVWRV